MRTVFRVLVPVLILASGCGSSGEPATAGGGGTPGTTPTAPTAPAAAPITAQVCAGANHTCVMRATGEVFCTGANLDGELGDSTSQTRWSWVPVAGLTGARSLACGAGHTCAITGEGAVSCWGHNEYGQLGSGNTDVTHRPVAVTAIADAVELALGSDFSCARLRSGQVSCWGRGENGRLGDGAVANRSAPAPITGLTDVTQISAGRAHACARKTDGTVWCWGTGSSSQLGQGEATRDSRTPVQVPGVTGATLVAAGGNHSCAANATQVQCWGQNDSDQAGVASPEGQRNVGTAAVVAGLTGVTQLDLDVSRSCARVTDGHVKCWGYNNYTAIMLGTGSQERTVSTPTDVTNVTVARFDTGPGHACGISATNQLVCWGAAADGRLGNGEPQSLHEAAVLVPDVNAMTAQASTAATFPATPGTLVARTEFAVGSHSVCGIIGGGRILCFGAGGDGRLGAGSTRANPSQDGVPVAGIEDAVQVDTGLSRSCALRRNGTVACWGALTNNIASSSPLPIDGITDATFLAVGGTAYSMTACVIHQDKGVSCFGSPLGASGRPDLTPTRIESLTGVTALRVGVDAACALLENGHVECWGSGSYGQLGNGATDRSATPVEVVGVRDATALGGGGYNYCARHRNGSIACWGSNEDGQLGNGESGRDKNKATPQEVHGLRGVASLGNFGGSVCVALSNGSGQCWGANDFGQSGHGDSEIDDVTAPWEYMRASTPDVAAMGNLVQMGCGWNFCCGLHANGQVSCAGSTPIGGSGGFLGMSNRRSTTPIAATGVTYAVAAAAAN